jgi:replication factor A1
MAVKEIIRQITSARKDLSVEDVIALVEAKKRKSGGYLKDEVAAYIVAAELGVKIPIQAPRLKVSIKNLVSGLGKVTVVGRVVAVYPPKTFKDPLGAERKTASLLIADRTGVIRVTLWNNEAKILEKLEIKRGGIVRISNSYVLEGKDGSLELRLGRKGEIVVNPKDVKEQEYPMIPRLKKVGELTSKQRNRRVSLVGKICEKSLPSSFERRNGSHGQVARLVLADETGKISVAVWNERVKTVEKVAINSFLLLVNAKVKEKLNQRLEVHVDHRTYVEVLDEETLSQILPTRKPTRISEITREGKVALLEGRIITRPFLREVETSKGQKVKVATFEIEDATGRIWVSAWRTLASSALKLHVGDIVRIENARAKKGFGENLEITTLSSTRLLVKDKENRWKLLSSMHE